RRWPRTCGGCGRNSAKATESGKSRCPSVHGVLWTVAPTSRFGQPVKGLPNARPAPTNNGRAANGVSLEASAPEVADTWSLAPRSQELSPVGAVSLTTATGVFNRSLFLSSRRSGKDQGSEDRKDAVMKLYCGREALLGDCQLASAAVASRDIKPILRNLKAVAEGDRCTLMATDLELGIRLEVRSPQVQEAGEAMLSAAKLTSILRESTDDHLTIEADAQRCVVTGEHNEFEMPGEDPADFPDIPTFVDKKYHDLTAAAMRTMIRRTVFAAAKESTRYAMTGVVWELEGEQARLVATDSKRLALAVGPAKAVGGHATAGGQSHIVPTKAMSLLARNLH